MTRPPRNRRPADSIDTAYQALLAFYWRLIDLRSTGPSTQKYHYDALLDGGPAAAFVSSRPDAVDQTYGSMLLLRDRILAGRAQHPGAWASGQPMTVETAFGS